MRFRDNVQDVIVPLLLLLAIVAAYHTTLQGPFVFDDIVNITNNHYIQIDSLDADALKKVFSSFNPSSSRPIANLTFALNYLTGGFNPSGFHLFNIVIHFITALLVFRLYIWYLKQIDAENAHVLRIALFSTLVWALNPMQINAVTYIVQRMTSLCTLFFIASLLLYLQARGAGWSGLAQKERKWVGARYLAALFAWCLALLTKEIAIIMPVILFLHEVFFFDGCTWRKIKDKKYIYLLGILLPLCLVIFFLWPWFWVQVTQGYELREFTLIERLLTQFRVVVRYISLFLMPLPSRLTLLYDYQISRSFFDPAATFWSALFIVSLLAGSIMLARKWKIISFCILWTFACLVIESTVFPLELVFEHRMYLPSVGLSLGVVMLSYYAVARTGRNVMLFNVSWACIICVLTGLTYVRNQDWRNEISFYSDAAEKAPNQVRAVNALGVAYIKSGDEEMAEQVFQQALQAEPQSVVVLANLFTLYSRNNDPAVAEIYLGRLMQAVAAGNFKCNEGFNLMLVSETLEKLERYGEIIFLLESLVECPSRKNGAYYDKLGLCYSRTGDHENAAAHFRKAVSLEPDNPYFLFSLARSYIMTGQKENARAIYNELQGMRVPEEVRPYYEQMGRYLFQ